MTKRFAGMVFLTACFGFVIEQPETARGKQRPRLTVNKRNLEIPLTEDVVFRLKKMPKQYDDKGKAITPTAAQIKELKGDPKLPGYNAEYSDLQVGQTVTVRLVRPRHAKKTADDSAAKPQWTILGEITTRVAKVESESGAKKTKKDADKAADAGPSVILEADLVGLARSGYKVSTGKGNLSLGDDIRTNRIMIRNDIPVDQPKTK